MLIHIFLHMPQLEFDLTILLILTNFLKKIIEKFKEKKQEVLIRRFSTSILFPENQFIDIRNVLQQSSRPIEKNHYNNILKLKIKQEK